MAAAGLESRGTRPSNGSHQSSRTRTKAPSAIQRCCPVLDQESDAFSCDGGSEDEFDIIERRPAPLIPLTFSPRPFFLNSQA